MFFLQTIYRCLFFRGLIDRTYFRIKRLHTYQYTVLLYTILLYVKYSIHSTLFAIINYPAFIKSLTDFGDLGRRILGMFSEMRFCLIISFPFPFFFLLRRLYVSVDIRYSGLTIPSLGNDSDNTDQFMLHSVVRRILLVTTTNFRS